MKLLLAIAAGVFFAMLLVWNWSERQLPDPPSPPFPEQVVEVGTNDLPMGTLIFVPSTKAYYGEVIDSSGAHHFQDGTIRPGVKVRRHFTESWVPRERLGKMVVAHPD